MVFATPWRGEKSVDTELLDAHYREVAAYQDKFLLDPDWEKYNQLDREGKLGFVRAQLHPLGRMIGYMAFVVESHMHYKGTIIGIGDVHYVHPDWRRHGIALRMTMVAEREAKHRGARFFVLREKVDHPHGDLYAKMGYKPIDTVYLKEL